jgi:Putative beta-barrel porin-2, OmpL-like. bbp2
MKSTYRILIVCLCLMLIAPGILPAQTSNADMKARIDELETLVLQLKVEMAAMQEKAAAAETAKTKTAAQPVEAPSQTAEAKPDGRLLIASLGAPPVVPASPALPQAMAQPAPAPSSPSLAGLLGSTTLTGYVDTYYGYNFNHTPGATTTYRAFDYNAQTLGLNLVELTVDKGPSDDSRYGYHVAVGYGQAINAVNAAEPGGPGFDQYLKEAYFSYLAPVGKGLQVDVGKFVTPAGAELIESRDNWNYSQGILFSYAIPFYHFGLRAKYAPSSKASITGFLVNGWNNVVDNNTGKTYGVSLALTPSDKFSLIQNYLAGPESTGINTGWRQLSDTVVTISPTSKFSFMANYDYGHDRIAGVPIYWTGIAGYLKYAFNDKYGVATRYEYYNDHDGFTTGTMQHLHTVTGTLQRKVGSNLITRLEYRRDISNQPVFLKGTTPVLNQDTVTAGLMFTFDSREAK